MSVLILRSIGTKLTNLENMHKNRIHVTQKRYVVHHGGWIVLIGIFISKSYGSNSGFHDFGDLNLDFGPILFFCHTH